MVSSLKTNLGVVTKNLHARVALQQVRFCTGRVGECAGGIGDDEEARAGIGSAEFLKFVLVSISVLTVPFVGKLVRYSRWL